MDYNGDDISGSSLEEITRPNTLKSPALASPLSTFSFSTTINDGDGNTTRPSRTKEKLGLFASVKQAFTRIKSAPPSSISSPRKSVATGACSIKDNDSIMTFDDGDMMPDESTMNAEFTQVMLQRGVEKADVAMRIPMSSKWAVILQARRDAVMNQKDNGPSAMLARIKSYAMLGKRGGVWYEDLELLGQLRVMMASQPIQWLEGFVEGRGMGYVVQGLARTFFHSKR